jgi:LysR family transcriptional regulator, hca operon transcriptional activator
LQLTETAHLTARKAIQLREIKGEPFIKPSKTAPTLRKIIEPLNDPASILMPDREVHNVAHAFSMLASTRAVSLLPAYAKNYLPSSVASRPINSDAPTIDVVMGYNKARTSEILKLFLAWCECLGIVPMSCASRAARTVETWRF